LGWEPKTSIVEGLEKTISYFKEQLDLWISSPTKPNEHAFSNLP
jgi:dTDP-D-glucose 4,6-dehydratase